MVEERENEVLKQLAYEKQAQKLQEASVSPSSSQVRDPKAKKSAKKVKQPEEPVNEIRPIEKRDIRDIVSELKTIQEQNPLFLFKQNIENHTFVLYPREADIVIQDQKLQQFIFENLANKNTVSPSQAFAHTRYFVVPISPEIKLQTQLLQNTMENDLPWLCVNKYDTQPLQYYVELTSYGNAENQDLLSSQDGISFRFIGGLYQFFSAHEDQHLYQIRSICAQIQRIANALSIHLEPERFDEHQSHVLSVLNSSIPGDDKILRALAVSKKVLQQQPSKQRTKSGRIIRQTGEGAQNSYQNDDLMKEVVRLISQEKQKERDEKQRQLQRKTQSEMEMRQRQLRIQQQQELLKKQQQSQDRADNYYIDKPLSKKPIQLSQRPLPIQRAPKPKRDTDSDTDSEEELTVASLRNPKTLKKFPFLKEMGSTEPPKLLPQLSQTQLMKGIVANELLKILPDRINSRQ